MKNEDNTRDERDEVARLEGALSAIVDDDRYRTLVEWGSPRPGHPEGTIRAHIEDLEANLAAIEAPLTPLQRARIRLLIHVHDTFKSRAAAGVAIDHPRSHASLARAYLLEFLEDEELATMVQWHDLPYALWRKWRRTGRIDEDRLQRLDAIDDWTTFTAFLVVDGCTAGKDRSPLRWFLERSRDRAGTWSVDDLPPPPGA